MRSRMIAFCLAIIAVCQLPVLPQIPAQALWLAIASTAVLSLQRSAWLAIGAAFILGASWGVLAAKNHLEAVLPQALEEVDFWVTGQVRGLPERAGRAQQLQFWVEHSCIDILPKDCNWANKIFSKRLILLNYYGDAALKPGQRWRWRVRLNQPHGFANPGGFDYEAWLMLRGFAAKGYVRTSVFNTALGQEGAWLARLRYQMRERLTHAMSELPNAGSLLALIMGERAQISDEQWALFSATGTSHLIVISGLHVGFIAWLCFYGGNFFARVSPHLLRRVAAQRIGSLCAIFGALAYSLLAGFSLPTQRAVIMLAVFMGAQIMAREYPRSLSYCLAMSLVLLIKPLSPVGAGFWLSFSAVATLLFAFGASREIACLQTQSQRSLAARLHKHWRAWGAPQWAVFIGMSVPLLIWTQQVSLFSPVANLVAIPLVSLLIMPLALLAAGALSFAPSLAGMLLGVADSLMTLLQWGLSLLTTTGANREQWQGAIGGGLSLMFALGACVLLLLPKGWPGRRLAPILLLPVLWPTQTVLPEGRAQLWVLDVGQGLAIVVRSANHVLLFDTGPAFSASFDAGSGVILPFLRHLGIAQIDHLVVSHSDNDHQGGLHSIRQGIAVNTISMSVPAPDQPTITRCQRGQSKLIDGIRFEFLMPPPDQQLQGNDGSCVLRIDTGGHSVLLTGDIERAAERELLTSQGQSLRSTILIAPHHGSQTSSSLAFVQAVRPQVVVYSAGYRSQFGHPAPQVAARYAAEGVCAWSTALSGALLFELDRDGSRATPMRPTQYRLAHPRFWHLAQNEQSKRLHGLYDKGC